MKEFQNRAVAVLFCMCLPSLCRADSQADALWHEVVAKAQATKTLTAKLTIRDTTGENTWLHTGTIFLQKPNMACINVDRISASFDTRVSDGKLLWELGLTAGGVAVYRKKPADPHGRDIHFYHVVPISLFFNPAASVAQGYAIDKLAELRYMGTETAGGETDEVLEQVVLQPGTMTMRLYITPDRLLHRVVTRIPASGNQPASVYSVELSDIVLDRPVASDTFTYTPPKELKEYTPPSPDAGLLPTGSKAPDIMLHRLNGRRITLREALRGKKALLLNFWFCGCATCRLEFPHLQRLYTAHRTEGLEIYGVSATDTAANVKKALATLDLLKPTTFPVFVLDKKGQAALPTDYKLYDYPTNYLLDGDGNIVLRWSGFDEKTGLADLGKALVQMGFSP